MCHFLTELNYVMCVRVGCPPYEGTGLSASLPVGSRARRRRQRRGGTEKGRGIESCAQKLTQKDTLAVFVFACASVPCSSGMNIFTKSHYWDFFSLKF